MIFLGVDPGVTGCVCAINSETGEVNFYDTPTVTVKSGKVFKNMMNAAACALLLDELQSADVCFATIEKVNAMPATRPGAPSMGATSAFNFGMGFGIWQGIVAALRIPYQLVHPATWKAKLMPGMPKEKDASRIRAMQLYPKCAAELSRKKDHGRADALLLAEFGRRDQGFVAVPPKIQNAELPLFEEPF